MKFPFGQTNDPIGQSSWALERTPPVRVLLIDDDDDEASLIRSLLGRVNDTRYELDWVSSYGEGLASIARAEHDAYLVDQQLGGRTGTELVREARETGSLAALIMMTGQRERATDMAAMSAGATDFLQKGRTDSALLDRTLRYAISQTTVLTALDRQRNQMAGLEELGRILVDNGPNPQVMSRIVDLMVEQFGLSRVTIYLAAGEDSLELAAERGHTHALLTLSRADASVDRVARARQPIFVPSFTHDRGEAGAGRGVATELAVPMIVAGELAGLLNVASLVASPIGEADFAAIRLLGDRLTAALTLVHERTFADATIRRVRREAAETQALADGPASVYRHLLLEPLLDAGIAAAGPSAGRKPALLLVTCDDVSPGAIDKLERHARAASPGRPLVRAATGELGVLMFGCATVAARAEARAFVDAARADGLKVWGGYATAAAGSTAAELVGAARMSLSRSRVLAAGTIVG
jgi:FixJ family two-component response regulator